MKESAMNEPINIHIMENEKSLHDWSLSALAGELYWWVDFFNRVFFKDQPVPVPAISFQKTKITTLGHYVIGRNAFGVKENINLNRAHLDRPLWDLLATLVHEMVHSWQAMYGKPSNSWFHNKEFQLKMLEIGIITNNEGFHLGLGDPFVFMLKKHSVTFNQLADYDGKLKIPPKPKPKGTSKLKKWKCSCGQIARVGKKQFFATCDLCNQKFEQSS
jgi:hypothetical protein